MGGGVPRAPVRRIVHRTNRTCWHAMHDLAGLYREQGRRKEARAACAECGFASECRGGHAATLESERLLEDGCGGGVVL